MEEVVNSGILEYIKNLKESFKNNEEIMNEVKDLYTKEELDLMIDESVMYILPDDKNIHLRYERDESGIEFVQETDDDFVEIVESLMSEANAVKAEHKELENSVVKEMFFDNELGQLHIRFDKVEE